MTAETTTSNAIRTYAIDKAHSEATFQVRHLVTKVRGHFTDLSGAIQYNVEHPERSHVSLVIATASIDTGTPDRDAHLRSQDFFHAEKFPSITFESTRITKKDDERYDVIGTLTIRDVAHELTLPVTHLGSAKDPWGNERLGFETEITINRKTFGLNWNAALETGGFLVGDEVKISASIQAVGQ